MTICVGLAIHGVQRDNSPGNDFIIDPNVTLVMYGASGMPVKHWKEGLNAMKIARWIVDSQNWESDIGTRYPMCTVHHGGTPMREHDLMWGINKRSNHSRLHGLFWGMVAFNSKGPKPAILSKIDQVGTPYTLSGKVHEVSAIGNKYAPQGHIVLVVACCRMFPTGDAVTQLTQTYKDGEFIEAVATGAKHPWKIDPLLSTAKKGNNQAGKKGKPLRHPSPWKRLPPRYAAFVDISL